MTTQALRQAKEALTQAIRDLEYAIPIIAQHNEMRATSISIKLNGQRQALAALVSSDAQPATCPICEQGKLREMRYSTCSLCAAEIANAEQVAANAKAMIGATVSDAEAIAAIWDAAKAEAAMYVENHCVDGEMHANAILSAARPTIRTVAEFASPAPDVRPSVPVSDEQTHEAACDLYDALTADTSFEMRCMDGTLNIVGVIKEAWKHCSTQPAPLQQEPVEQFWNLQGKPNHAAIARHNAAPVVQAAPAVPDAQDVPFAENIRVLSLEIVRLVGVAMQVHGQSSANLEHIFETAEHMARKAAAIVAAPSAPAQEVKGNEMVENMSEDLKSRLRSFGFYYAIDHIEELERQLAERDVQAAPAVPDGWEILRTDDGKLNVLHSKIGSYIATKDHPDKNVASAFLYELADAMLAAAPSAPSVSADALQELADQAQVLDMGYGPNACPTCGKSADARLQKIVGLAQQGMCHGLLADDYCRQIAAIAAQSKGESDA